jgi:pSer/pThr/pTyr-binding forkhead associated (FHA) protein
VGCSSSVLGRADGADVRLDHPSVSERHAELRFDGSRWSLLDCGSSNGTVVDGQAVTTAPAALDRNSLICVGALRMVFLCAPPRRAARGDRDEERALDQLARAGRLDAQTTREILRLVRSESGQSIAEIVLRDTPVSATDWASAVAGARARPSLLRRLLRILSFGLL